MKTITLVREHDNKTEKRVLSVEVNTQKTWGKWLFVTTATSYDSAISEGPLNKTTLIRCNHLNEGEDAIETTAEFLIENGWTRMVEVSA